MRRRLVIVPLVLTAALTAGVTHAAGEASTPTPTPTKPVATVRLTDCSIDVHSATFRARMAWFAGTDRMWLRFKLLEKGVQGFHVVQAPGLGRWRKSKPSVSAFGYRQVVLGLKPGALYRALVDFHWYDSQHRLLAKLRRSSHTCRQFQALPNLAVALVDAQAGSKPGVVRYRVIVVNKGTAPASGVPVRLWVDGQVVNTLTIATLPAAGGRQLTIQGPRCKSSVQAAVDPDGQIVESSETDNVSRVACSALPQP
jgi:hypothetical protein